MALYKAMAWRQVVYVMHPIVEPSGVMTIHSLAPERLGTNFTSDFFNIILWIHILSISYGIDLWWVQQNPLMISEHSFR